MAGTVTDFFNAAWADYLRQHPGADKQQWFAANGTNLQRYYDTTVAGQQQAAPAPAAPQPAPNNPNGVANLNNALDRIMASEHVDRNTAAKILRGEMPRPSDSATTPQGPAGVPVMKVKPGLDWAQLSEAERAAKAREEQARQDLMFQKGVSTGKVDGTNTMESVKYGNEILSNPQFTALSEQVRKGYALGDKPGQTVADYLNRTVDNPVSTIPRTPVPGRIAGGPVVIPGAITGAEIALINDAYAKDPAAAERWFGATEGARKNVAAGLLNSPPPSSGGMRNADGTPFDRMAGAAPIPLVSNANRPLTIPEKTFHLFGPEDYPFQDAWNATNRGQDYPFQDAWNATNNGEDYPFQDVASSVHDFFYRKTGGQVTVGGEPHWIVDNSGAPVAALSEDGKKEQVKGKAGVEVVPLDPKRHAAYEAKKKNVPGLLNGGKVGQRQAPSRRPGSTSGNSRKTQSGTRRSLPDGSVADGSVGVGDGRRYNGATPVNAPGASNIGQVGTDKDAQGILPSVSSGIKDMAAQVQAKIQANGPVPVKVTPGASYMPNNPAGGPLGTPVTKKPDMTMARTAEYQKIMRPYYDQHTAGPGGYGGPDTVAAQPVGVSSPLVTPLPGGGLQGDRRRWLVDPNRIPTGGYATTNVNNLANTATAMRIPGRAAGGPVDYAPIGNAQVQAAATPTAATAPSGIDPALTPVLVQIAMQYGLTDQSGQPDLVRAKQLYDLNPSVYSGGATGGVAQPVDTSAVATTQEPMAIPPVSTAPVAIPGRAVGGAIGIPQNEVVHPTANTLGSSPVAPGLVTARPPAPTFIGSGGARTIGNNVASSRFGFDSGATTNIAGQNQRMGIKNNPGVFVQAAWKWNPATLRNMTTQDRIALESQIRATGQDPASFYDQAKYAEPGSATSGRAFY